MNYFEFKQQLLRDSFTKDEEFHRLRKEDIRCAKAYEEAMNFEKTLKNAFAIKTPDNLKDSIILRQTTETSKVPFFQKYAIAASIVLSFVALSSIWYLKQTNTTYTGSVEKFITTMFSIESNVKMSDKPMLLEQVNLVFAEYNTKLSEDIGKVHFIHDCHTPGGSGVHMVVATNDGPVTVYYMPKTHIEKERVDFNIDEAKAILVNMEKGSLAIIADSQQQLASIEPLLQDKLLFL